MAWKNVALIGLALAVWGGLHAYGAYLFNHDPRRAVITSLCTGGFLAFWGGMLLLARSKFAGYAHRAEEHDVAKPGSPDDSSTR